jgi:hypothetical protein
MDLAILAVVLGFVFLLVVRAKRLRNEETLRRIYN